MKNKHIAALATVLLLSITTACNNNTISENSSSPVDSQTETTTSANSATLSTTTTTEATSSPEPIETSATQSAPLYAENETYNNIDARQNNSPSFWAQYGTITVEDKEINLKDDFDSLDIITDSETYNEIYSLIAAQNSTYYKLFFTSTEKYLKDGLSSATKEETDEYIKNYMKEDGYYEINPEAFGFSDMDGMHSYLAEIYDGITKENLPDYAEKYKDIDGKLCVKILGDPVFAAGVIDFYTAKYQTLLIKESDNSLLCLNAYPESSDDGITGYILAQRYVKSDGKWKVPLAQPDVNMDWIFTSLPVKSTIPRQTTGWW